MIMSFDLFGAVYYGQHGIKWTNFYVFEIQFGSATRSLFRVSFSETKIITLDILFLRLIDKPSYKVSR